MNNIFEKLKVDFKYITGFEYKGLIASIGAGFASRLAEFQSKLDFMTKQAFVSTSDKDYLYLHTGKMLPPFQAKTAKGFAVFYGEDGAVVPIGTELTDSYGTFHTIAKAQLSANIIKGTVTVTDGVAVMIYPSHEITNCSAEVNGVLRDITVVNVDTLQFEAGTLNTGDLVTVTIKNTAIVQIISNNSGAIGNRNLNDVLRTKITIENIDKDVGVITVDGGKDAEDVEEYRERVKDFLIKPQSPFNENNIKHTNLNSIETLRYVWVRRPVEGEVKVVALNKSLGLTTEEKLKIVDVTKSIAPAQMDRTAITSASPVLKNVQVVVKDLSPNSDGLKSAVEKNIKYIYDKDMYEKGISTSQLEAIIYKTRSGAEVVDSFTLISGSTKKTDNTFWKYTGTTFQ